MVQDAKTLWLIRHGALPEEHDGRYIGTSDIPLSAQGRREAAAVGRLLARHPVDAVYAGTLQRVRDTVECAAAAFPLAGRAMSDPRLNEVDFGRFSNLTMPEIVAAHGDIAGWSMGNDDFTFPDGENMRDFHHRVESFLADIAASPHQTIAVFSHGGVIMTLIAAIIGLPYEHTFSVRVERGALARLTLWDGVRGQLHHICRPLDFEANEQSNSPTHQ